MTLQLETKIKTLTRKSNESIIIAGKINVKVLAVRGDQVSLGITAPDDIGVDREEIHNAKKKEQERIQSCSPKPIKI